MSDSQRYPLNLFLINYKLDIHVFVFNYSLFSFVVSEILEKLSELSPFQAKNARDFSL